MKPSTHNILFENKLITEQQHEQLESIATKKVFSVYYELRTLLYLGVLLFTAGVGYLIYQNLGEAGHYIALSVLSIICTLCFNYVVANALPYSNEKQSSPTPYFDYVLLLGSLLLISIQAYLHFLFDIFAGYWSINTLVNAVIFFALAYRYNHIGILSLAITSFASFLGINVSPQDWVNQDFYSLDELYNTGIGLSILLAGVSELLDRKNIKKHFSFTYVNFASIIFSFCVLSGLFKSDWKIVYFILLAFGIAFMVWYANRNKSFLFLIYAFLTGYIGVTYLLFLVLDFDSIFIIYLWSFYTIASCVGIIKFITHFKNYYKE